MALRFPAAPASVCCIRFEDHASAALKKHAIFWAVAGWGVLETNVLPDGGTSGVFAADSAGRIRYLFGTRETRLSELRAILTSEQLSPGDADPSALADLLSLVLLTDGNVFHSVVEGRLDIPSGDGYEIDWRELLPHWLAVRRPRWQTIGGEPALVFYTIGGWMHETTTLARHRVFLDLDSMIRLESDVLSTAVYSSLPLIEY